MYIKAARKQEFEEDLSQLFVGIGIRPAIDPQTKQFLVLSALPDSPAFAAGIRGGDRIIKIDGQSTQGRSLKEAVERIRGKPGTSVTLTVQHAEAAQPIDLVIVRQTIHEDTVQGDSRGPDGQWNFLLPPAIGGSAMSASPGSPRRNRAKKAPRPTSRGAGTTPQGEGPRAGARPPRQPGRLAEGRRGHLRHAGRQGRNRDHAAAATARSWTPFAPRARPLSPTFPWRCSSIAARASASEIVAACLQDHDRAIVVGERSYGKGTVQEVIDMGHPFGAMKLTIATYWRPSGQNINRPKEDAEERRQEWPGGFAQRRL